MALPRPTSNASERAPASLAGLFRWDGPIGPRRYALVGICLMALKYAVDAAALYWVAGVVWTPLDYLSPLRLQSRTALREHLALHRLHKPTVQRVGILLRHPAGLASVSRHRRQVDRCERK